MDAFKEFLSVLGALIGLISTWLSYRTLTRQHQQSAAARLTPTRIQDPSVRARPWSLRRLRWIMILPILVNLIIAFLHGRDIRLSVVPNLAIALLGILFLFGMRTEPPSRTFRKASLTLAAPPDRVLQASLDIIIRMGARVALYDQDERLLQARKGMSWRTFGQVILIRVVPVRETLSEVTIEVDALLPSTVSDMGANTAFTRSFQAQLLRVDDLTRQVGA
jgi:hypothetical protein